MQYIFSINGEEREPTIEERQKMFGTMMKALGYRPVGPMTEEEIEATKKADAEFREEMKKKMEEWDKKEEAKKKRRAERAKKKKVI